MQVLVLAFFLIDFFIFYLFGRQRDREGEKHFPSGDSLANSHQEPSWARLKPAAWDAIPASPLVIRTQPLRPAASQVQEAGLEAEQACPLGWKCSLSPLNLCATSLSGSVSVHGSCLKVEGLQAMKMPSPPVKRVKLRAERKPDKAHQQHTSLRAPDWKAAHPTPKGTVPSVCVCGSVLLILWADAPAI